MHCAATRECAFVPRFRLGIDRLIYLSVQSERRRREDCRLRGTVLRVVGEPVERAPLAFLFGVPIGLRELFESGVLFGSATPISFGVVRGVPRVSDADARDVDERARVRSGCANV